MKNMDTETKMGGLFGIIALIAIAAEVTIAGFSLESIIAGLKDIAGTLVAVMVFIVASNLMKGRSPKNFNMAIKRGMDGAIKKYPNVFAEMERKENDESHNNALDRKYRYTLSTNISAITGSTEKKGRAALFCDFDRKNPTEINFYLNDSTFGKEALQNDYIAAKISMGIANNYKDWYSKLTVSNKNISVIFDKELHSVNDANKLVSLIEYVILLYIVLFEGE